MSTSPSRDLQHFPNPAPERDYAAADQMLRLAYRIHERFPHPWIGAKLTLIFGLFGLNSGLSIAPEIATHCSHSFLF